MTDGAGNTVATSYTPGGKPSAVTDAMGNQTTYQYDQNGRQQLVVAPAGETTYTYDARGNRASVTAPGGGITTFTYDAANRLLTEKNPLGQVTTYTYNPDGTRATKLDGKGNLTSYGYDPNKRLVSVTFADGTAYAFQYDSRGHRTLEQSPDESRTLTYDALGRLATAADAQLGKTLSYGYDAVGNRVSMSYDGLTTAYTYDQANRLTQEVDPDGESTFLAYDPGGRRTSLAQGNGVVTSYAYDPANRLTSLSPSGGALSGSQVGQGAGASPLPSFTYTYDTNGNPLSKAFADGTKEQYLYDGANRLIDFTNTSGLPAQYNYFGGGGLWTKETLGTPAVVTGFTDNAFNQVTQWQPPNFTNTIAYDANGNRTSLSSLNQTTYPRPPAAVTTYAWNDDDRLASVTLPSGQVDSFKYDANGIRVGKSDSTGSIRYLIDPLTKAILATYDAGTGLSLAQYSQNPQKLDEVFSYKTAQGTKYYPHTDMLGSVYALSDSTGTPQATWTYDVYGARTQTSGTISYAFGFTGREHDGDTGLIYSRARYYDPAVGSWLSKDRIGYQAGPNLYQYVNDNPTRWTDPSGNIIPLVLLLFVVGALAGFFGDLAAQIANGSGSINWTEAFAAAGVNALAGAAAPFAATELLGAILLGAIANAMQFLVVQAIGGNADLTTQAGLDAFGNGLLASLFFGAVGGGIGGAVPSSVDQQLLQATGIVMTLPGQAQAAVLGLGNLLRSFVASVVANSAPSSTSTENACTASNGL